jgi:hypothetical protein
MSLILRIDVDKPFGTSCLIKRIISKTREDYWLPALKNLGYLRHAKEFISILNQHSIKAHIYFRMCTAPDQSTLSEVIEGEHLIGLHCENTKSFESFNQELQRFKSLIGNTHIDSFTKHGSGTLKLGRNHYPPYEPEKYKDWAQKIGLNYYFGNGIISELASLETVKTFYPEMFWIEADYRHPNASKLEKIIDISQSHKVAVLIHPCNYYSRVQVKKDFDYLLRQTSSGRINWALS